MNFMVVKKDSIIYLFLYNFFNFQQINIGRRGGIMQKIEVFERDGRTKEERETCFQNKKDKEACTR